MSPRPGGEADKIGNRYEGAWTIAQLLQVLAGPFDWVRVEPLGDLGDGVEFILRRADGGEEAHQVKRQRGNENEWSVPALKRLRVWRAARRHTENDRDYHLVSMVPFRLLQELTERARNSNDYASFVRGSLPKDLNALFVEITDIYGDPEVAWRILRRFYVRLFDEMELRRSNAGLAGVFLEGGSGRSATASLGDVIDDNIDAELTSGRILEALKPYDLRRRLVASQRGLAERIRAESSAWLERVGQQLIEPKISRQEAEKLRQLPQQPERVHFLLGVAGGGKTAVLHQAVEGLLQDGVPTLVVRLDRYGALPSTAELGRLLNLDVSPVTALAAAANGRPAVLVVDQLDAVSLASGRLTENFDVVADLIAEAANIPNLHVLLGCRHFDVDNDHRIRNLRSRLKPADVSVAPLTDEQIDSAVTALGLPITALKAQQRSILRLPLHLSLLATVADRPDALNFPNSQWLFDAFWDHKRQAVRQRRKSARFGQVVSRLADEMSSRQRLQVPVSVLDAEELGEDAGVLVSEQLLVRDGAQIGFFHEALFDYAFARQWVNRGQSLVQFLTEGEQELFRRAQVRQIMTHLRATDAARFREEVRGLFASEDIRFHIKDVALAVLGGLSDPTSDEASLLLEVAAEHPEFQDRLWMRLRNPAWFQRLDADGYVTTWLSGDEAAQTQALNLMAGAIGALPDRIAELLAAYRDAPTFADWLRWAVRFANIGTSRPLFELFLDGVRMGAYANLEQALWLAAHNLAEAQPEWAVELLDAFLANHPAGLTCDALGRVKALEDREHGLTELVTQAAERAPQAFLDTFLPYLLRVMAATAYEDERLPRQDRALSRRTPGEVGIGDLGDVIFAGAASAIRSLVAADPEAMRPTLQLLADDPHDNAQYLLYQGLLTGGDPYADWAAELLLQGKHRFLCGLGDNSVWVAAQVLKAISPLIDDELLGRLETAVRDLRFSWEVPGRPVAAFTLLSALGEGRLSEVGRRRLGELRRAVGRDEPAEPEGITGGWIGSPIAPDRAARMTDGNWLSAMTRHAGERKDFRKLTGGARELSHVLKTEVAGDPVRFARLARRVTTDLNSAYGDALLMGFGEANPVEDPAPIFDAVRHIASLGLPDNDRWLGYSLRPYFEVVPADLAQLIRDRALNATDPADDRPVFERAGGQRERNDLWTSGINTARGSLAEALGDLLVYDVDGSRTALVAPVLNRLAADPVTAVRTGVAHTVAAALRYARPEAIEAFGHLVDADDLLLATQPVVRLIMYLGNGDPAVVRSTIERMLASAEADVREAGGELAAFGAMQWDFGDMLQGVLAGDDAPARKGAASMFAHRLPHTADAAVAADGLMRFVEDDSEEVREAAAEVAAALRDQNLRPFEDVLKALMASPAFRSALPQLLITLEHASDRVDDLALVCAQRFVEVLGEEAADIRTSAAGDARHVGQLIIRGLAQSETTAERAALLDVLDGLLLAGAYGIEDLIGESERPR
jgi:hypothetical protein